MSQNYRIPPGPGERRKYQDHLSRCLWKMQEKSSLSLWLLYAAASRAWHLVSHLSFMFSIIKTWELGQHSFPVCCEDQRGSCYRSESIREVTFQPTGFRLNASISRTYLDVCEVCVCLRVKWTPDDQNKLFKTAQNDKSHQCLKGQITQNEKSVMIYSSSIRSWVTL